MSIIIDLKNAIRKAVYRQDNSINFNFNEIQVSTYPYIFFYIPRYSIIEHIDPTRNKELNLQCVLEYAKEENPQTSDLWAYEEYFRKALNSFEFLNTKIFAQNPEYSIVDGVLQMTFDLTVYVKEIDETELMEHLEFSIKGA